MPDSDEGNPERIRNNQRRSRARRKEYLQEIEGQLRQCELTGIEASPEIQSAARKVLEENRRLRTLLVQHGVNPDVTRGRNETGCNQVLATNEHQGDDAKALESLSVGEWKCCGPSASPPDTRPESALHCEKSGDNLVAISKETQAPRLPSLRERAA
ncbi:hypothetical protein V490_00938 [Pseudogymnoascus sp. VKM F-3557]|nr:hypothetical protein V490_00938 [Pseudogymnoascus sp. VKM F-3557]